MNIEKYKSEIEEAIYEGPDGKYYIAGKVFEKVLFDAIRKHDFATNELSQKNTCCGNWDENGKCRCQKSSLP